MRVFILIVLITIFVSPSLAQEKSNQWFEPSNSYGGFGGLTMNYGLSNNVFFGGEGAFRIKNYYFGGFGYGLDMGNYSSMISSKSYNVQFGEGGILLGAISNTSSKWALFTDAKIGFGEIRAKAPLSEHVFEEYESKTVSVLPKIGIAFAPIEVLQIKLFAGYSFFSNPNFDDIVTVKLNNPTYGLSLYFGYFR